MPTLNCCACCCCLLRIELLLALRIRALKSRGLDLRQLRLQILLRVACLDRLPRTAERARLYRRCTSLACCCCCEAKVAACDWTSMTCCVYGLMNDAAVPGSFQLCGVVVWPAVTGAAASHLVLR